MSTKYILCLLTIAKDQLPYAHNQNDMYWSPQITRHVRLQVYTGTGEYRTYVDAFAGEYVRQSTGKPSIVTQRILSFI